MDALAAVALAAAAAPLDAPPAAAHLAPAHSFHRLTVKERYAIIALHENHQSIRLIHHKLGFSRDTIAHWIEVFDRTGDVKDAPRSGRPRCTDEATDINIAVMALIEVFTTP